MVKDEVPQTLFVQCTSQQLAHRRLGGVFAVLSILETKPTWRLRSEKSFLTLNRHGRPNFAVMYKTAFFNDVVGCSPRR